MKIPHTHMFDSLCKIVALIGSILLASNACMLIGAAADSIAPSALGSRIAEWTLTGVTAVLFVAAFIGSVLLFFWALVWNGLPTLLYVRLSLCTSISLAEAKEVTCLFDGSFDGRWHPLKDLLLIPEGERKEILFRLAKQKMMRCLLEGNR